MLRGIQEDDDDDDDQQIKKRQEVEQEADLENSLNSCFLLMADRNTGRSVIDKLQNSLAHLTQFKLATLSNQWKGLAASQVSRASKLLGSRIRDLDNDWVTIENPKVISRLLMLWWTLPQKDEPSR